MMNVANEITHHTKLFGFIGLDASSSAISSKLNSYFKMHNKDAKMLPLNIREDDLYFTLTNMKKSHLNGAIISSEYSTEVLDTIDVKSPLVQSANICDVIIKEDSKLYANLLIHKALKDFLEDKNVKNVALLGINGYAYAFMTQELNFNVDFYYDNLEALLDFTQSLNLKSDNINRIAQGMSVDFSSYDALIDFSDFDNLNIISSFSAINIDLKPKKIHSPLREATLEYFGFENMLEFYIKHIYEFLSASLEDNELKF